MGGFTLNKAFDLEELGLLSIGIAQQNGKQVVRIEGERLWPWPIYVDISMVSRDQALEMLNRVDEKFARSAARRIKEMQDHVGSTRIELQQKFRLLSDAVRQQDEEEGSDFC